jgi:syntaxin 5
MVAEQRETVQRIDADTMDIASNVSGAQRELLKYYASISSNRWLMLKVFGVLIVFVSVLFEIMRMSSELLLIVPCLHSRFMT